MVTDNEKDDHVTQYGQTRVKRRMTHLLHLVATLCPGGPTDSTKDPSNGTSGQLGLVERLYGCFMFRNVYTT